MEIGQRPARRGQADSRGIVKHSRVIHDVSKITDATRRYLQGQSEADLAETMVFLGGPRQVGTTTLAPIVP